MRVLFDLNVLLDVVQNREPFVEASAEILNRAVEGALEGYLPGHAVTTLHHITARHAGKRTADEVIDNLLAHLDVAAETKIEFLRARGLAFDDFEDAVTASAAVAADCDCIVTRNVRDFDHSPVPALTPAELLAQEQEATGDPANT